MSQHTGIEWTHHTFNPVWGCLKVSPGCAHCYADTWAQRFGHQLWGPAGTTARKTFGAAHWREPRRWERLAAAANVRRRVFCGSMCDVFEDHPTTNAEREKLWPLIKATPHLDWLLLTKRPERVRQCLPADWLTGYPNVWLGTSVEDQKAADTRIPALLEVPAILHFLSCEPLLGPVELDGAWHDYLSVHPWTTEQECCFRARGNGADCGGAGCTGPDAVQVPLENRVGWVIGGGESGPDARPCDPAWLASLRSQCAAHGVPFFLKQLGGYPDKRGHADATLDGHRYTAVPHVCPGCAECAPDIVDPHNPPEGPDGA